MIPSSRWMPIHFRPPKKTSGYFYICPKGMLEISFRRSSRQITNGFRVRTGSRFQPKGDFTMEFFNAAVDVMKTVVVALGGGLGVFGERSICWRATAAITRRRMLMYGREAQSKTKTASPATIPKSGERNRKIHSCMLYLISI